MVEIVSPLWPTAAKGINAQVKVKAKNSNRPAQIRG
jgi:hypothetical protein